MKKIGVVVKVSSPLAKIGLSEVIAWLDEQGKDILIDEESATLVNAGKACTKDELAREADLIVIMGGDGTFLSVARMTPPDKTPLLGVNLGSLGFLTEFALDEAIPMLARILEGDFRYEDRIMLDVEIVREGKVVATYTALNDLVIHRAALARMVDVRVAVNDHFMNEYTADGLIIATPTGSTAYNLSANGPIIHPSLNALIISPICPHTLSNRPVVIPDDVTLELALAPGHDGEAVATLDGQIGYQLSNRDRIIARRSERVTRVILSPDKNYFRLLREKLKWGETIRTNARKD